MALFIFFASVCHPFKKLGIYFLSRKVNGLFIDAIGRYYIEYSFNGRNLKKYGSVGRLEIYRNYV